MLNKAVKHLIMAGILSSSKPVTQVNGNPLYNTTKKGVKLEITRVGLDISLLSFNDTGHHSVECGYMNNFNPAIVIGTIKNNMDKEVVRI